MKIAITSSGNSPDAIMDSRFGRCKYFVFYDTETGAMEFLPNPNIDATRAQDRHRYSLWPLRVLTK